jgi:hypothetical protein
MNGPEVYATIFSVGPGKKDVNVIWTGSDDGLVHVTRDGGKTWANVTPKGMPDFGRVSQIDASSFNPGGAYVSVRRPLLDDRAPYIFRTADYGRTWTLIVGGIRPDAYVHAVREDPTRRGLLYAGTQHGVYLSQDDGATWQSLSLNMPDVPVSDLIVEGNELVISTHGRAFWVLDNIAPLRQITSASLATGAALFQPPVGIRSGPGIVLSWWQKTAPSQAKLEILDSTNTVVRLFERDTTPRAVRDSLASSGGGGRRSRVFLPDTAGLNQLTWDLRAEGPSTFPGMILWGAGTGGPALPPGRYTVRLTSDGRVLSQPVRIVRNPRITDVTDADLQAQYGFSRRVRDKVTEANDAVIAIRRVKAQLEDRYKQSTDAALRAAGDSLKSRASAVEGDIYQVRNRSNQDPLNFPIKVNNRLANLMSMAERGDGRPTTNMPEIFQILNDELKGYTTRLAKIWAEDLENVNRELARLKLERLDPRCPKATGCPPPAA